MSGDAAGPERLLWSGRAYVLLGTAAALVALAIPLRSPVPLFLALPLLFAPFAASALAPPRRLSADVSWRASGLGPEVAVEGAVRGSLGPAASGLAVEVPTPPGATVARPLETRVTPDGLQFRLGWTFQEPVLTEAEPPTVSWRDPLGLFEKTIAGARPRLTLERYPPEVQRIAVVHLRRTIAHAGETRSHRVGPSGEFFGVREATPGEPRSRINWRASARAGRLLANDYEADQTGDLLLLLDVRPTSRDRATDERLLGIARAGTYGIAEGLLRTRLRLGFAAFGEFLQPVPLSSGRAHRIRVLGAIASSRLSSVAAPPERCAYSLGRFFRPGLTTVVVSSWTDDPTEDLMPYLRHRGYSPVLVSPSPLPLFQERGRSPDEDELLARRVERLERRTRLAENWKYGPVVDWDDYWTLDGLVRLFRSPSRRRVA